MSLSRDSCPCDSALRYSECCGPLHEGLAEAADARWLMRSRYSAFAVKDVPYLWKTLHPDHDDRQRSETDALREIRATCDAGKFLGLTLERYEPPDEDGIAHVTFLARVFRRGQDCSFRERSAFARAPAGWRYLMGVIDDGYASG